MKWACSFWVISESDDLVHRFRPADVIAEPLVSVSEAVFWDPSYKTKAAPVVAAEEVPDAEIDLAAVFGIGEDL